MKETKKQIEFLELLEPVHVQLGRFARALTKNREDAKDLASDAIMIAYENFDKIRKKDSFKSYIFSVAARQHKKKFRRKKYRAEFDEQAAENIPWQGTSPETNADIGRLYAAIGKLPEKEKVAVTLFELSGFSLREIREMQGGTLSGVKTRLRRAREKLASLLIEKTFDGSQSIRNGNGATNKGLNRLMQTKLKVSNE